VEINLVKGKSFILVRIVEGKGKQLWFFGNRSEG
jgi:hypothetical protein